MRNFLRNRLSQKIIASFMTFVMVLSIIPLSSIRVMAAADASGEGDVSMSGKDARQDVSLSEGNAQGAASENARQDASVNEGDKEGDAAFAEDSAHDDGAASDGSEGNGASTADGSEGNGASSADGNGQSGASSDDGQGDASTVGDAQYGEAVADKNEQDDTEPTDEGGQNAAPTGGSKDASSSTQKQNGLDNISIGHISEFTYNTEAQNPIEYIAGINADTDTVYYKIAAEGESVPDNWTEAGIEPIDNGKWIINDLTVTDAGIYEIKINIERKTDSSENAGTGSNGTDSGSTGGNSADNSDTGNAGTDSNGTDSGSTGGNSADNSDTGNNETDSNSAGDTGTDNNVITKEFGPYTVTVNKAGQEIEFKNDKYKVEKSKEQYDGIIPPEGAEYDFSAVNKDENISDGGTFSYSLDDNAINKAMAAIDANSGILTVYKQGTVTVTAKISGNKNYEEASVEHTLTVKQRGYLIAFDDKNVSYTLGENGGTVSEQQVTPQGGGVPEGADVSYAVDKDDIGIACDASDGKVSVSDYEKLSAAMNENGGEVTIEVTATAGKGNGNSSGGTGSGEEDEPLDVAAYEITISYAAEPTDAYSISGDAIQGDNGWYKSVVELKAEDGYSIAPICNPDNFGASITFDENNMGKAGSYIYIMNVSTGAITAKTLGEDINIDTTPPKAGDITIKYLNKEPVKVSGIADFYFYNGELEVEIGGVDAASGIDSFSWKFVRWGVDENAAEGEFKVADDVSLEDASNPHTYTAKLKLPETDGEQLKGYLIIRARDKAGHESKEKIDDKQIVVVDTKAPVFGVEYEVKPGNQLHTDDESGIAYCNDDVTAKITIDEANFYSQDVKISVTHNGEDYLGSQPQKPEWSDDGGDSHSWECILKDEGEYVVKMSYADRSGNTMVELGENGNANKVQEYSKTIIIDKTAPEIEFTYLDYTDETNPQTAEITVTERYFDKTSLSIEGECKDIEGNPIANNIEDSFRNCEWSPVEGKVDTYTASISAPVLKDGIYKLKISYTDMAGTSDDVETQEFIVDHVKPDAKSMRVDYSETVTPIDTILSVITFRRYYNPSVEVTFTAYDEVSGIERFAWGFNNEAGIQSDTLKEYAYPQVLEGKAVKQDGSDASLFRACVTLPLEEAQQLRGNIIFSATDKCGNESDKKLDSDNVIIVDTIPPELNFTYTPETPDGEGNDKLYYNKDLEFTFTVTETNFYSEDIGISLSKNGSAEKVNLDWTDNSVDEHVAKRKLEALSDHSNDGEYVFEVEYTDKSLNKMGTDGRYTSDTFVIDTTAPVFGGVTYEKLAYKDEETGFTYYNDTVMAQITITEKNFYEEDVIVSVIHNGKEKPIVADWIPKNNSADTYIGKFTLEDEGEYHVNISYKDRCGNVMEDASGKKIEEYRSETIIVDKTNPVIMFSYPKHVDKDIPQVATITIIERNFDKRDVEVEIDSAQNIKGEDIQVNDLREYFKTCQWSEPEGEPDTHIAQVQAPELSDAIYVLKINYKDLAQRPALEVTTNTFIVDHVAPDAESMSVDYSEPLNLVKDTILSVITFRRYYNPSVEVTFTGYDDLSGIDYFTYSFKNEGGMNTNKLTEYENIKLDKVEQDKTDLSLFSASLTLPLNVAEQLRGNLTYSATDKNGNESDAVTDAENVIIVDTIKPKLSIKPNQENRYFNKKKYYNKDLTLTFTLTEMNFFSEDIVIEVSKNKGRPTRIEPSWKNSSTDKDVHIGTYTIKAPSSHSGDGDYVVTASYKDRSNNEMDKLTSETFVIDTITPVIEVTYSNSNIINTMDGPDGNLIEYYAETQVATVTVNEHNFNPDDVEIEIEATDHAGGTLDAASLSGQSSWSANGDRNTMTITYPGDANYSFGIKYTDLATNEAAEYEKDYFAVDTQMPEELTITYSTSVLETILANITFGFYNAKAAVTIEATDNISGVYSFKYSYINAQGVSPVNSEMTEQVIEDGGITYSNSGMTASATFEIPVSELGNNSQFNGTVNFNATDRAGNESEYLEDERRVVVDNIAPDITVEYNAPVQAVNGISYYDDSVTATVTINEANFYSEDVEISVSRDGASYPVSPSWSDNSTDVHVGSFSLSGDGDYFVNISCSDKSGNVMDSYESEQLTIDTEITEAIIMINGEDADGKAFKDEVVPFVSFEDDNFDDYDITLTRTSYADKNVDVTDKFISGHLTLNARGGSGTFDTFDKTIDNDGIYTLSVSMKDKSGHTAEKTAVFTVNRYGSVYEYSDYLVSLISGGGAYVPGVEDNLIITEYNPDRLVSESLEIVISKDGKPIETPAYSVTPEINPYTQTGSSGWYQYQYTINRDNFAADGLYKISVSSMDETGNTPENNNYQDKLISFWVDSTAPEINSVTGLEEHIINAASVDIKYTVYDTIGLDSVTVYVSGQELDKITDFSEDANNYSGSFTLYEDASEQNVRLVVKDLAGNMTDTSSESFTSAFVFNSAVTISTNILVRWYADKMLFWGSIGGFGAAVCGLILVGVVWRRKKEKKAQKAQG